ncbi:hypothetical protein KDA14_01595, partial [Candidatus Saccharibacteria bacterium]|nr:hypothetical protein [Candidatus Saccharibacteria bacterium]
MQTSLSVRRSTPRYIHKYIYAFAAGLWLALNVFVPATQAQKKTDEQLIARKPFVATVVTGVGATKNKSGTPLAVTMPRGINGLLEVVDLKKMQRVLLQEQRSDGRDMVGQAYVTLPNRHVLVATDTGNVYDVDPDKLTATDQTPPDTRNIAFDRGVLGTDGSAYFTATDAIGATHILRYTYGTTSWREIATVPAVGGGLGYDGAVYIGNPKAASVWR